MLLVVDTTVLVADLLRIKGREHLSDHRLDLYLPEHVLGEVQAELPRRIRAMAASAGLEAAERDDLLVLCLDAVANNLAIVVAEVYSPFEEEAVARSQRDPADWPVVACALALSASVWTNDNDFLGTGVPTWTTQTLQTWLERRP